MKTKEIVYISLGVFLFLVIGFLLTRTLPDTGFDLSPNNQFEFNFSINETGQALDGEIVIDNRSFGHTKNGIISIEKENLSRAGFDFKTEYNGKDFSFYYEFYPETDHGKANFIVLQEQLKQKKTYLEFYETLVNCSLNGKIYVDDKLLGETKKGKYELSEKEYIEKFRANASLQIYGLSDLCFGKDENLPFTESWIIHDLGYYLYNNENVSFDIQANLRKPTEYIEMQGFVRPDEVKPYLESELRKFFKDDTEENLNLISKYGIHYRDDFLLFQKADYWQTPAETLKRGEGDCEDWAVTVLSLIRAYNVSLKCFNMDWQTHLSVFCYFNNKFIIYDQERTKFKTGLKTENTQDPIVRQENQITIRNMRNNYLTDYGIPPDQRKLFAVFNEKELVIFDTDEDFVNWALTLIEKN